jgi:hypothetical protein
MPVLVAIKVGPLDFALRESKIRSPGTPRSDPSVCTIALVLLSITPGTRARAEDSIEYWYSDYSEAGDRMKIQTQTVAVNQELGFDSQFGLGVTNDAISGASPTGARAPTGSDQVPLASVADHRKEWEGNLARQFDAINVAVGLSESREHDYVSDGWSLNTLTNFNKMNTILLVGMSAHDDSVESFLSPERNYVQKHVFNGIAGLTQDLDPLTSVTLNLSWGRETGYLADQYKIVEKTEELAPGSYFNLGYHENLPDTHDFGVLFASVNRAFPKTNGGLEVSYRYYADTYGVTANTVDAKWLQKIGRRFTLAPDLRLHEQGAASFYYYNLDDTNILPLHVPNPNGPTYTSDYRLSSLYSVSGGLELECSIGDGVRLEISYDHYLMRGTDGVTPESSYPSANILSASAKFSW